MGWAVTIEILLGTFSSIYILVLSLIFLIMNALVVNRISEERGVPEFVGWGATCVKYGYKADSIPPFYLYWTLNSLSIWCNTMRLCYTVVALHFRGYIYFYGIQNSEVRNVRIFCMLQYGIRTRKIADSRFSAKMYICEYRCFHSI